MPGFDNSKYDREEENEGNSKALNTKALMARQFKGNKYSATRSEVEITMMLVVTEKVNTDMIIVLTVV